MRRFNFLRCALCFKPRKTRKTLDWERRNSDLSEATHAAIHKLGYSAYDSHRNRLPPDLYKCGGSFSLGHSLQTMAIAKQGNDNSVRNKSEHSIFYRKDKTRLGRFAETTCHALRRATKRTDITKASTPHFHSICKYSPIIPPKMKFSQGPATFPMSVPFVFFLSGYFTTSNN